MTSTTLSASAVVQKASTHKPGRARHATYAPNSPLRTTTCPSPFGPTPRSRKEVHALSTSGLLAGPGMPRSARASSAFGL